MSKLTQAAKAFDAARTALIEFEERRSKGEPVSRAERIAVNQEYQQTEAAFRAAEAAEAAEAEEQVITVDSIASTESVGVVG